MISSFSRFTLAALACVVLFQAQARADGYPWNWNVAWGPWNDPESWSGKAPPDLYTNAFIGTGLAEVSEGLSVAGSLTLGIILIENGVAGSGLLEVTDSGSLLIHDSLNIGSYGLNSPSNAHEQYGRMLVSGADAGVSAGGAIRVGMTGRGVMIIEDGAFVGAESLIAGNITVNEVDFVKTVYRGTADIQVNGEGSTLDIAKNLDIGVGGDASLQVTNGGMVFGQSLWVGGASSGAGSSQYGTGRILLSGTGSLLELSGTFARFTLGVSGSGEIRIEDGAVFDYRGGGPSNAPLIGASIGSEGLITVTGAGSRWRSASQIYLGDGGTGILTIEDGGLVRAEGGITNAMGSNFTARGGIVVRGAPEGEPANPGILETTFVSGGPSQTLLFDSAILRALTNESNFIRGFGSRQIFEGGLTIDTDTFLVGVSSTLTGLGSLSKDGEGTLTLRAVNPYAGGTVVREGTLLVEVDGAVGSGTITLQDGVTLGKSVATNIVLNATPIVAEGDFTLLSPGGNLYMGDISILAEEAILSLAPSLESQTANMLFIVNGRVTTDGDLILRSLAENASTTLSLTSTNEFGGKLTVEDRAILQLSATAGNSANNELQINAGGIVRLQNSEQISDSHTTRVNGVLEFHWTQTLTETLGNLEGAGIIRSYAASSGIWNQTLRVNEGIFAGSIQDGGTATKLAFRKIGDGTLALLGTSSFGGQATIEGGTLLVGADDALGVGSLMLMNGVTLGKSVITDIQLGNAVTTLAGDATFSSPGGDFRLNGVALASVHHTVTLAPASSGQSAGFSTRIEGVLSGGGDLTLQTNANNLPVIVALSGTASNTQTGLVTVKDNVILDLEKEAATAISGDLSIEAGGIVRIKDNEQIANTSRVYVDGRLEFGATRQTTETVGYMSVGMDGVVSSYDASGDVGSWNQTLRVYEGIFYGTLSDGSSNNALSLEKLGPEVLFVGGYGNTYSGDTHVRGGALSLGNIAGSATGTGDVHIHEGGRLDGNGSIAGNLYIDGEFYPGYSPGMIEVGGDLTLSNTSLMVVDVWFGDTPGITYDQVIVGGNLIYGGILRFYFNSDYVFGGPLQIFDVAGFSSGMFSSVEFFGLPEGVDLEFDYINGRVIDAIPEPSTYVLVVLAFGLFYLIPRVQKKRCKAGL